MKVQVFKTNERLGLTEGEIYEAERYWLDPNRKVVLQSRIPDGYNPECTAYFDDIKIITE